MTAFTSLFLPVSQTCTSPARLGIPPTAAKRFPSGEYVTDSIPEVLDHGSLADGPEETIDGLGQEREPYQRLVSLASAR